MAEGRVWYVAYGSNLSSRRLARYLDRAPADARGRRRPRRDTPVELAHRLFFAHESRVWTGGTAFLDPGPAPGVRTLARAWLVTVGQFWSVLAQENGRRHLDADPALLDLGPGERAPVADTRYGLVLGCESPDHRPALTFTTPATPLPEANVPAPAYVGTIVDGLVEGHGLVEAEARSYVDARTSGPARTPPLS